MIEDTEQNSNDGSTPADLREEYREENRYSVPFSTEHSPENPGRDSQKNDAENARIPGSSPVAPRLARAELEETFRNDPRLSKLFDHKEVKKKEIKKPKKQYVKVGGIRLTPKRLLILSIFFLIILFCIGGSLYYAFKDIGKYRDYSRAAAMYEAGDYGAAKDLFVKVINEDPNKEEALVALAQIFHFYRDWGNEAFFRQRIMRLNPLNQDYFHDYLESAFRARNFSSIYSILNLKIMENPDLPPDEGALYLISALHSGHVPNGKAFYEERRKANPRYFTETERGRFADLLLNGANMNKEQAENLFSKLDQYQDPQVRFEMDNVLLYFYSKRNDQESDERMELLLLDSVKQNDYAGAFLLANYYFQHYRFKDVIRICDEFMKTRLNAVMPVLYGESALLDGQPDLIPPMSEKIRGLHGRQSKMISSYLDALTAFSNGDIKRMHKAVMESGSMIDTPLFSLMNLHLAIYIDSPKEVLLTLGKIMRGTPFLDFQARARSSALSYLLAKVDADFNHDPDLLTKCAEIAALIQTEDDDVSFLRRIILLDHFKRKVMTEEELLSALNAFPGDPFLLKIAAEFSLSRNQPAQAMEYLSEYQASVEETDEKEKSVAVLHIIALDQLDRKEDAQKEFRTLVEKEKDGLLLNLYYEYCIENGYLEPLKELATWLEDLPKDAPNRAAIPFVRAEILLAEGQKDQALDLFKKSSSDNPKFVFHAASRLAENGRPDAAFNRYLSIKDSYPDKAQINIALSDLYLKKGDEKNALACARAAWEENRNDLLSRYLYGKRLFEAGQYQEAISVLKFPQYHASFPQVMLDLWSKAIHAQIKDDFEHARYTPAEENIKYLLIYFPDDKDGLEYAERIRKIRRHETVGGKG